MTEPAPCSRCAGTGRHPAEPDDPCPACGGDGSQAAELARAADLERALRHNDLARRIVTEHLHHAEHEVTARKRQLAELDAERERLTSALPGDTSASRAS